MSGCWERAGLEENACSRQQAQKDAVRTTGTGGGEGGWCSVAGRAPQAAAAAPGGGNQQGWREGAGGSGSKCRCTKQHEPMEGPRRRWARVGPRPNF